MLVSWCVCSNSVNSSSFMRKFVAPSSIIAYTTTLSCLYVDYLLYTFCSPLRSLCPGLFVDGCFLPSMLAAVLMFDILPSLHLPLICLCWNRTETLKTLLQSSNFLTHVVASSIQGLRRLNTPNYLAKIHRSMSRWWLSSSPHTTLPHHAIRAIKQSIMVSWVKCWPILIFI